MVMIVYILAFLGILFILFLFWLGAIAKKAKNELRAEPREFKDAVELMGFIRNVFDCQLKDQVVLYGFVESIDYCDGSATMSEPVFILYVVLITRKGHEKVLAPCGNVCATLKKGDFVAVMPFYSERHKFWYYATIAKLKPYYLGEGKGFFVDEQYVG
ncbi:hypothetical protein F974_01915 [Acinetobacter sp. CIP 102159]|uniref:hypothetical protein n=1 Tax=Acinetobacter sp. CIP 102159 TaxID=1144667 RepID=UPI0002D0F925|nr:hypothetical protein [Acinetobacter sp. CIP 102159]ENU83083.1 hypothetical protein F974_01915 [Acinetobacter sp. CIP 102159]